MPYSKNSYSLERGRYLFVDGGDEGGAEAHAGQEAAVEVVMQHKRLHGGRREHNHSQEITTPVGLRRVFGKSYQRSETTT